MDKIFVTTDPNCGIGYFTCRVSVTDSKHFVDAIKLHRFYVSSIECRENDIEEMYKIGVVPDRVFTNWNGVNPEYGDIVAILIRDSNCVVLLKVMTSDPDPYENMNPDDIPEPQIWDRIV